MPWGNSGGRALEGQGSRENRTSMKEVSVKDSQNGKREQSKEGIQKKNKSFLRNEKEELALI